jgi:hypothetical protein
MKLVSEQNGLLEQKPNVKKKNSYRSCLPKVNSLLPTNSLA